MLFAKGFLAFHLFIIIARCSKYDFWNLGEIWDRNRWPKHFRAKKFRQKKSENCLVENCLDQTFSIFLSKKISLKKSMKIQNFEISIFSKFFRNFEISFTFSTKKCSIKKSKIFGPTIFRPKSFRIFFDEIFFVQNFLGHVFRSQIFPRFQKSCLENRAMTLNRRKPPKPIWVTFFPRIWERLLGSSISPGEILWLQLRRQLAHYLPVEASGEHR